MKEVDVELSLNGAQNASRAS